MSSIVTYTPFLIHVWWSKCQTIPWTLIYFPWSMFSRIIVVPWNFQHNLDQDWFCWGKVSWSFGADSKVASRKWTFFPAHTPHTIVLWLLVLLHPCFLCKMWLVCPPKMHHLWWFLDAICCGDVSSSIMEFTHACFRSVYCKYLKLMLRVWFILIRHRFLCQIILLHLCKIKFCWLIWWSLALQQLSSINFWGTQSAPGFNLCFNDNSLTTQQEVQMLEQSLFHFNNCPRSHFIRYTLTTEQRSTWTFQSLIHNNIEAIMANKQLSLDREELCTVSAFVLPKFALATTRSALINNPTWCLLPQNQVHLAIHQSSTPSLLECIQMERADLILLL